MIKQFEDPKFEEPAEHEALNLSLHVTDPIIVRYLSRFPSTEHEDKALEALKVGVIAIQSASPTLDARIVEEQFREVQQSVETHLGVFQVDLKNKLDEYFKEGTGKLPYSFETFLGGNGKLQSLFGEYFAPERGKISSILQQHLGPASQFAKSLDPDNKASVLSRIEEIVTNTLSLKASEIVEQLSLDKENSALSRIKTTLSGEIEKIKKLNESFFADLREDLGLQKGKATEAIKGTEKGREFEVAIYERLAPMAKALDDIPENVRGKVGVVSYSKKGDFVVTLSVTSGAPGKNIVFEAKKERGYKLKDAVDELNEAKKNREADAGVFVFANGCAPIEVGDFHRIGNDFFITADEESAENGGPLIFLEAAYKITRTLIVNAVRKEAEEKFNAEAFQAELNSVLELVQRLGDLSIKARTISSNSKIIEETMNSVKPEIESKLKKLLQALQ